MTVKFFSVYDEYGCFSNLYPCVFEYDGLEWESSEHAFQAMKFDGVSSYYKEKISETKNPWVAIQMARRRSHNHREDWDDVRLDIMKAIVLNKFEQNPDLGDKLLNTGDQKIVEDWHDSYWGDGSDGEGENKMGLVLMETRNLLR